MESTTAIMGAVLVLIALIGCGVFDRKPKG